jgi:hypothetical protein
MSRESRTLSLLPASPGPICALLCCLTGFSPLYSASKKIPGTPVEARLLTPLSSYTLKPGFPVEAVLSTPVCTAAFSETAAAEAGGGGAEPIPSGAILRGKVTKVHRVGLGLVHETASIQFQFDDLQFADGRSYAVESQLTSIDNAREHIDSHGKIRGIRATATLSNRVGQRLAFLAFGHPAAMLPLFAIETSMFHFPEPEIELARGADLRLSVQFPLDWGPVERCAIAEQIPESEWKELRELVASLPYWTYSKRQPQPMDLVNLVYIGSEDSVARAFAAAGWLGSRPNSMHAGIKAIRAIAENHALGDAPMRTLLLDGAGPDMQLQKSLDTFEKRDHLRVWARDREFQGEPVWASAATRDLAAVFSMRPFGFTHQIQDDVDLERDQVVSDLSFTGCVDSVAYVSRPETVRTSGEKYRKGVYTDSRVAVITLNACRQPLEDLSDAGELHGPGRMVRWIRRVTLTARNHYLRDNIVWRSGDAVRLAFQTVKGWRQEAKNERHARELDAKMAADARLRGDYAVLH